jgi:hypothetical protein
LRIIRLVAPERHCPYHRLWRIQEEKTGPISSAGHPDSVASITFVVGQHLLFIPAGSEVGRMRSRSDPGTFIRGGAVLRAED